MRAALRTLDAAFVPDCSDGPHPSNRRRLCSGHFPNKFGRGDTPQATLPERSWRLDVVTLCVLIQKTLATGIHPWPALLDRSCY